jgi:hypothetical protein
MLKRIWIAAILVLGPAALLAMGDWNPGDPAKMHHPQLPDLRETGMDVYDSAVWMAPWSGLSLADDWQCSQTGFVKDIHLWGSWKHDDLGVIKQFRLSVYNNNPGPPSTPCAPLVWTRDFAPGEWVERLYEPAAAEDWYDPTTGEWMDNEHQQCWQYNFLLDPADWFWQEQGKIYWLEVVAWVQAADAGPQPEWGWKTARPEDRFMDDAVYYWEDRYIPMVYPDGHALQGETLDLAFVITPEPATMALLGCGALCLLRLRRRRR